MQKIWIFKCKTNALLEIIYDNKILLFFYLLTLSVYISLPIKRFICQSFNTCNRMFICINVVKYDNKT